jgi:bifunctional non-homologous end joining protein LigD
MLAGRGLPKDLPRLQEQGYVFDLKVDGVRAMVTCDADQLSLLSRNDKGFARRFPELIGPLEALRTRSVVLDTEIAVSDQRGLPSWPLTQQRTARQSGSGVDPRLSARLYVFDLLRLEGTDTTGAPFRERRQLLQTLARSWSPELVLTVCSEDHHRLWELVVEHRLEGVIAKRADSPYRSGRGTDWIKIKSVHTLTCLVGGVTWAGAEGTSEPRSLDLYLVDANAALVPVGSCSAGVGAAMRRELVRRLRTPPLVVEVEYSQVTTAHVLRHPVLRALRPDVGVLDCGVDQLGVAADGLGDRT